MVGKQEEQVPGAQVREEASGPCVGWGQIQLLFPGAPHQGAENAPKVNCAMMGVAQDASREAAAPPGALWETCQEVVGAVLRCAGGGRNPKAISLMGSAV